jgi:hypoxanthine phosphoribosyltransferase
MNKTQYQPGDVIISQTQIKERLEDLAFQISQKYKGKNLLVVGILKGAFKLTADLTSKLHEQGLTDLEISFVTLKSYPDGTRAKYEPNIVQDMDINPEGRHVLLVDDVLDTGRSLQVMHKLIESKKAKTVESFALVDKPERRQVDYKTDYVGFTIPDIWLQGYGMDTAEAGRADPDIIAGPYKY